MQMTEKAKLRLELETLINLTDMKPLGLIESIEDGLQRLRLSILYLVFDTEALKRELRDAKKGK